MSKMSRAIDLEYSRESKSSVQGVVESLTQELGKRKFGVLNTVDIKKIVKQKMDEEIDDYVILDVCSPVHAKRAIDSHKEVGLVLPCKIIVYSDSGKTRVSLFRPTKAIDVLGLSDLGPMALEVEDELKSAIDAIA